LKIGSATFGIGGAIAPIPPPGYAPVRNGIPATEGEKEFSNSRDEISR